MQGGVRQPRKTSTLIGVGVFFAFFFVLFVSLGTWQVERRAWKLDLIARVEQRVHAPAVDAPGPATWARFAAETQEYRHVRVEGRYLSGAATQVQAVTKFGPGFWRLVPLRTAAGWTVLVNRGFVPAAGWQPPADDPESDGRPVQVTGLLRVSEPGGAFLRRNVPAENRWYSRDVAAIAGARHLHGAAPYFIDAADTAPADGRDHWPRGGLTVTAFRNSHMSYLLTWYGLALLVAYGAWHVAADERRVRRRHRGSPAAEAGRGPAGGPDAGDGGPQP